jgi:hypothetical protein
MPSLKGEIVLDSWDMMVDNGAGRDAWVLERTEQLIKDATAPNITLARSAMSIAMFGAKRDFLVVRHKQLKEYSVYIGAMDYGRDLYVSWYLTVFPAPLKRFISKKTFGNPQALSTQINLFDQQDLRAYASIAHHSLKRVVDLLGTELQQDFSGVDRKSKGFLAIW